MMSSTEQPSPGGFYLPPIPSPASSTTSSKLYRALPTPRTSPLKPGSKREAALIRYLDDALLQVSRKYTKKYNEGGYSDIRSVIQDLEKHVELIWVSGTASIQVPYLLQIADTFNDYLASFPPYFRPISSFFDLLDRCFYSLITGLPSSPTASPVTEAMNNHRLSTTEKVRLKSIIERTRLHMVRIVEEGPSNMANVDFPTESDPHTAKEPLSPRDENHMDTDGAEGGGDEDDDEDEELEMLIAKIYERSLLEVGDSLKRLE